MNFALLLPAALAALTALLLPLLIHLARRSEQRPTVFAALRWLQRKPKPRHRVRFDEWPLLLVRLLLLVLLALLLARPVLHGAEDDAPRVVVAPGVQVPADRTSVAPAGARWHRLEPGFRLIEEPRPTAAQAGRVSVTSLLREFDASLPPGAPLTVLVPPVLDGVDGQRPRLSRPVEWRVARAPAAAGAQSAGPDVGKSGASKNSTDTRAPRVSIRFAEQRGPALPYLRAALAAWSPAATDGLRRDAAAELDIAGADEPLPASARHLIWLAPGALPPWLCEWTREGGTVLLDVDATPCIAAPQVALWRDDAGLPLVEAATFGRGRMMRFTREFAPQSMPVLLEGAFASRLRTLFEPAAPPPARVSAAAHVPLVGGPRHVLPPREVSPWLIVLVALVFAAERAMATGRRQGAGP